MSEFKYYYTSNVGKCRKANQDNLYCNGVGLPSENNGIDGIKVGRVSVVESPVFAVFDGMGGEERGEMAAYLAANTMAEFDFGEDMVASLSDFCKKANNRICDFARENEVITMGTTAAILRFSGEKAGLCNVGDSKIFLSTKKELNQLSFDHVGISVGGRKPPLTQNLGIEESELIIEPYIALGDYKKGNTFLICSDGLSDMVSEERIKKLLRRIRKKSAAKALLREALKNGGRDNITFILICVK